MAELLTTGRDVRNSALESSRFRGQVDYALSRMGCGACFTRRRSGVRERARHALTLSYRPYIVVLDNLCEGVLNPDV